MILATPDTITGFSKLMAEAGLTLDTDELENDIVPYLDNDDYEVAMERLVNKYWLAVGDLVDTVTSTRDPDGTRQYIIIDGDATSENPDRLEVLLGWALFRKGSNTDYSNLSSINTPTPSVSPNEILVQGVIDGFVNQSRAFTSHDVTTVIRRDVNNGKVDWAGRPTTSPSGDTVGFVAHEDVQTWVHNYMPGITDYEMVDNGIYQTYRSR